ncbi:hypothetical protein RV03_GL002177 [Enterococcus gallinarum]|nr:hypothetical protein RV03_GL002177 [Enterococcus gallinarum]
MIKRAANRVRWYKRNIQTIDSATFILEVAELPACFCGNFYSFGFFVCTGFLCGSMRITFNY